MSEILLVGNPNAGKSTLFNQFTGLKQQIGNFPGITVDKSFGQLSFNDVTKTLVDLPGVYSLMPQQQSSQDERVTLNYLLENPNALVVDVVDATSLERHLYLTLQLRELGVPMVVVLNKWDLAQTQQLNIDIQALEAQLQCPVFTHSAHEKINDNLLETITKKQEKSVKPIRVSYESSIETLISDEGKIHPESNRFTSILKLIEQQYQQNQTLDIELSVACERYQHCNNIVAQCMPSDSTNENKWSERLDSWLLKPWVAIPTFLFSMYLMFMFAINIGGAFIDFFDIAVGAIAVDGLAQLLNQWHWPQFIVVLLTDGMGTGIQTVSTFIPLIFCLYLFLTSLEQSGYLARAAVVTDRLMQKVGLPGSAFVPLMMGFGCTVPAVMATRTLKQKRERILSSAMSHFMVCGARLPVFALFGAAFFLDNALDIVFLLYLLGIVAALLTGFVFRKTILDGESSPFIIELPQYQVPKLSDLFTRTTQRLKGFVFGAGKTIVIVVTILGVVNSMGKDGSFGNQGTENSLLSSVGQIMTPVFHPLGIENDNWQATVGIFTGLFAKEVLVASLNSLYQNGDINETSYTLTEKMSQAVNSISDHFSELSDKVFDPLGLSSANVDNVEQAANSQDVSLSTMAKMAEHFDGKVGAFSYLLFILLYAPCASALGAIAREFSGRWALLIASWATLLAYVVSSLFYQLATLPQFYSSQMGVVILLIILMIVSFFMLSSQWLKRWVEGGSQYVAKHPSHSC